ncbi:MAG: 4-(cytidine 5'-diphospho)-2-C-methyl-D-erythritol kinase [Rhizobiaceae bacterium]|nr:4-(cytidine 5'-diphospho)-2-C-methyl-D-erythritol kinase [Rhizobiaceae bacterium]
MKKKPRLGRTARWLRIRRRVNTASPRIDDTPPAGQVSVIAPAKINLALHVTGRREDGYHDIETLAVFARFGDRIVVSRSECDRFSVSGRYAPDVPLDATNLVLKARDSLREAVGEQPAQPVAIDLEKNLPVASGVGGGSSDAAATLRALCDLWDASIHAPELAAIGLRLGADVPMCLAMRPLLARGIGDDIAPIDQFPALGIVLVNPGVQVSTAQVFGQLERTDHPGLPPLPRKLDFHSLRGWLEETRNDLQPAACTLQPPIAAALSALKRADAAFWRMSGSGATCFGLYESGNAAKRAAAQIRGRHPDWFVAATRTLDPENAGNGTD